MQRSSRLALLLLPLAFAGCGGTATTTPPAATGGNPTAPDQGQSSTAPLPTVTSGSGAVGGDLAFCDLLTDKEVSDITGAQVAGNLDTPMLGQIVCMFTGADGAPVASYVVNTPESPIDPEQGFEANAGSGEAVAGLGDRAAWATLPGAEFGTVYVLAGGNLYAATAMASTPDSLEQRKQASIELARLVIERDR